MKIFLTLLIALTIIGHLSSASAAETKDESNEGASQASSSEESSPAAPESWANKEVKMPKEFAAEGGANKDVWTEGSGRDVSASNVCISCSSKYLATGSFLNNCSGPGDNISGCIVPPSYNGSGEMQKLYDRTKATK